MREWIDLCETVERINEQGTDGKFWYDTKTREVYPFRGHHALAAFKVLPLRDIIRAETDFEESDVQAALNCFTGDGGRNDNAYMAFHDRIIDLLVNRGFIRGIADLFSGRALSLEFAAKDERGARELAEDWSADRVVYEILNTDLAGNLRGPNLDRWLKGTSVKRIHA